MTYFLMFKVIGDKFFISLGVYKKNAKDKLSFSGSILELFFRLIKLFYLQFN